MPSELTGEPHGPLADAEALRERTFVFSAGGLLWEMERDVCEAATKLGVSPEDALMAFYGPEPDEDEMDWAREKASRIAEDQDETELFTRIYIRHGRMIDASRSDAERTPEQRALLRALSVLMPRPLHGGGAAPGETAPLAILMGTDIRVWSSPRTRAARRTVAAPRRRRHRTRARARSPGRQEDDPSSPLDSSGGRP